MGKNGEPYLEVHHVVWLSRGGADSLDNTVALCPNCHARVHILDAQEDIEQLKGCVDSQC
ncbi:MAG: HNH endonuclease [Clostridiales bacterium]|nr:HNH endonuclease [Clostridiales bacterium]